MHSRRQMRYCSRQFEGITDLINLPALINLDFADVQTVMKDKGMAHIGIGSAQGMIRLSKLLNLRLLHLFLRQR